MRPAFAWKDGICVGGYCALARCSSEQHAGYVPIEARSLRSPLFPPHVRRSVSSFRIISSSLLFPIAVRSAHTPHRLTLISPHRCIAPHHHTGIRRPRRWRKVKESTRTRTTGTSPASLQLVVGLRAPAKGFARRAPAINPGGNGTRNSGNGGGSLRTGRDTTCFRSEASCRAISRLRKRAPRPSSPRAASHRSHAYDSGTWP